jgi:type I restriction enzyme S subunit
MNGNEYRETDVGQIPADWEVTPLGNVLRIRGEGTQPSTMGTARYVGLEHIDSGSPKLKRWGIESEVRSSKNKFYAGDILYGKLRPYLDKVALAEWEGICATDILVFKSERAKGSPEYLVDLLHTAEFLNFAISTTTGVNHPRTSWNSVNKFTFGLPPLPEQKKIAAILSKIQQAIEVQEKIIEVTKELKKTLMAKLFTEGLHGEELKETEIGLMPKSWEVTTVGSVMSRLQYGISVRGERDGKYPILRMNNLQGGYVSVADLQRVNLEEKQYQKFKLAMGDILFNRTNSHELVGKAGIFLESADYTFASYLIRLESKREVISPAFVNYYLNLQSTQNRLKTLAQRGVGQSNISAGRLSGFKMPLCALHEQNQIELLLQRLDSKLALAHRSANTKKNLYKSMLHELMTGGIRVKEIEILTKG